MEPSLQVCAPRNSSKLMPQDAKMRFPEGSGYDLAIFFVASFQDPEFHHLIVTTAKTQPSPFLFVTEVHHSISLPGSCIILSDTSWNNTDGDFQDKRKEFHTEILEKYMFHLCKYSLFKLNKFLHITSWYTPAFVRTVIFYVIGLIVRKWDGFIKKL